MTASDKTVARDAESKDRTPGAGPTLLAALTAAVLRAAEGVGVSSAELLRAAGLTAGDLANPDGRIALELHLRLITALSHRLPPVGLEVGERLGAQGLGVVGYAMQHDATLGSALAWLERYRAVVFQDVVSRMEEGEDDEGRVVVFSHVVPPRLAVLREPAELWAAAQASTLRQLTGQSLFPKRVHFPHAEPEGTTRHRALFRCKLVWSSLRVELHYPRAILDYPLVRADSHLFRYLARRAEELHAGLPSETLTRRVRQLIEEGLAHGEPDMSEVSRKLALSARTLQRRLSQEATGFAELLDDVRRERALLLLDDSSLTVSQVSFLLGYSEPAAFFRAFRRWTGATPQDFREARAGEEP